MRTDSWSRGALVPLPAGPQETEAIEVNRWPGRDSEIRDSAAALEGRTQLPASPGLSLSARWVSAQAPLLRVERPPWQGKLISPGLA